MLITKYRTIIAISVIYSIAQERYYNCNRISGKELIVNLIFLIVITKIFCVDGNEP